MQKTPLIQLIREELTRALVFAVGFFAIISLGFVGVAHAANGGIFGDILNRILASGNWEAAGDGTVKNSMNLGGSGAENFVRVKGPFTCPLFACVTGIDADGTVLCVTP